MRRRIAKCRKRRRVAARGQNRDNDGFPLARLPMPRPLPTSIDDTQKLLAGADYVAERNLATSLFLALAMRRPLFLEGEAGEIGRAHV